MNKRSKIDNLQDFIEKMIDEMIRHDLDKIRARVQEFKLKYRKLSQQQIAQKIVGDQSFWGGLLALSGLTSFGGLRTHAYMICCLRDLYEYPLNNHDAIKTDFFLLTTHSSIEELEDFICCEVKKKTKDNFIKKKIFKNLIVWTLVPFKMDWWTIKRTGKLAIDYYERGGPDFLDAAYALID